MSPRLISGLFALSLVASACADGADASSPTTGAIPSTIAPSTSSSSTSPTTVRPDAAGCSSLPTGLSEISLDAGGAEHAVRIRVPTSFSGDVMPAVLNWHGLGSNGLEQLALTNYETLAEAEGFVAVHASGVPDPLSGRNSWELIDDQDPARDDLEFADALIDELVDRWCVDADRVYSTGMSNGGLFTARLVCERADRIAAAVSVAGTSHQADCAPSRSVPYWAYHGTADEVVPFDGNGQSSLLVGIEDPRLAEFFAQVIPEEFAEFGADFGCSTAPTVVQVSDDVKRYDYEGCDVPLSFFEIADGGHTWPGSPLGPLLVNSLGYTTPDVSATADGWAFMSQFSLSD